MLVSNSILSNLFERTDAVLKQPLPPGAPSPSPQALAARDDRADIQSVLWPSA